MRVLLISANTETINMPVMPMGLGAVAAATEEAGHEVVLLDLMGAEDSEALIEDRIEEFQPRVIGISVRNIDDQDMENTRFLLDRVSGVIQGCRAASVAPIVLGGPGYSMFPDAALSYLGADLGIRGEGENAFPSLLAALERGEDPPLVPGLHVRGLGVGVGRVFARDLDSMPFPDPGLWPESARNDQGLWVPVQSRRGCPMDCSYCSTRHIEGRIIRRRSPLVVVDEVTRYFEAGFRRFHFVDNVFNLPPSYALDLCRALGDRGLDISWRCIIYPAKLDRTLVREMARAGCREVSLGFESGCDRILRAMNKRFKREDVRRASKILAEQGIARMGFLLLGGPGENRASVEESLAFVDSLKLEAMKITLGIRIYPDTALAETAVAEGVITPEDDLLFPRFYLAKGIDDRILDMVRRWEAERPQWVS